MPVGARNLELAMATVCCVLRPGFPSGGDRPLVGCAVGGAGDLPPRCGARCQLRRVHCWLAPPLHAQRMIFVPFAVAPPVASRHSPDCTPVMVPLALRFHCWLAVPWQSQMIAVVPLLVPSPFASRHLSPFVSCRLEVYVQCPVATILAWTASSVAVDG